MTKFNAFQHDGFGGLVNSGFNARNGCVAMTQIVGEVYVGSTKQIRIMNFPGATTSFTAPNFPSAPDTADFDGLRRVWSYHFQDAKLRCSTPSLSTVLYTSPATVQPIVWVHGGDKEGACYTLEHAAGQVDPRIVKHAPDLSGAAWTSETAAGYRSGRRRPGYVEGLYYWAQNSLTDGSARTQQLDAATGAVNWTMDDVLFISVAPGGGFLGIDFTGGWDGRLYEFYDKDGLKTGVSFDNDTGNRSHPYVTRFGYTYAATARELRVFNPDGTLLLDIDAVEAQGGFSGPMEWAISDIVVNDCNPTGSFPQVYIDGYLETDSLPTRYGTFRLDASEASPRLTPFGGRRSGAWGFIIRSNGHWATHT